ATIVALMLNKTMRFSTTYRVIYLVPNITSMVAMGILFSSIFSSQFGLANAVRNLLGQENIAWLHNEWGIKIAISSLTVWSFVGYNA
ncbi:cytochrome C biogenesis protein, partial [Pseudomonas sp. FW305-60]